EVKAKMIDSLWHGMLHAKTQGIDFIVLHLSPSDYKFRQKEASLITAYMKQALAGNNDRVVVLGDYNAHSPFDSFIDKQRPLLLSREKKADAGRKYQNLVHDEQFDYSVMSAFLAYPLIDICERTIAPEDRFSFPTPILIGT